MREGWFGWLLDPWLDLVHGSGCAGCGRPGRVLCVDCRRGLPDRSRPVRPTPCPEGLVACFAAGEYDGVLGRMVVAHKERAAFPLARPLGVVLASAVGPVLDPATPSVLVPVPSRPGVVRARGHDPMLRVSRVAARRLRRAGRLVEVATLLEQHAPVADQVGLGREQRAANLAGSMRVRPAVRDRLARRGVPLSLVVCDDLVTTGATAREAQRTLEDSGLPVRAVVTVAATRKRIGPRAT
jgi:predicted amidophosphoribosyltransferase